MELKERKYPQHKAAAFYCVEDGTYLYADNIHEHIAPASIAKLVTAATALKYISPETVLTVGSEHSLLKPHSSLCLVYPGHALRLFDLLSGLLISSGSDAAFTIAVYTARAAFPDEKMDDEQAVQRFMEIANSYAKSIGMNESFFVHPEGWDSPEQYTTVSDLIKLAVNVLSDPVLSDITSSRYKYVEYVSGETIDWINTNAMLRSDSEFYCPYACGIKTGTTDLAGCCLLGAFRRNGKTYVSMAAGCENYADLYGMSLALYSDFT